MREIKFRGKSLNTGEWVKGYYLVNRGLHYIAPDEFVNPLAKPSDYEVDPDTVGQYTGAKDSKGKEIYEGDIVKHRGYNGMQTSVVKFEAGAFIVGYHDGSSTKRRPMLLQDKVEVIGNIHDNPELLER